MLISRKTTHIEIERYRDEGDEGKRGDTDGLERKTILGEKVRRHVAQNNRMVHADVEVQHWPRLNSVQR